VSTRNPRPTARARAEAIAKLRLRLAVYAETFCPASAQDPISQMFRAEVEKATTVTALKVWLREFRGMAGGLAAFDPNAKRALHQLLLDRCGPDPEVDRDAEAVRAVLARGKIRSEREYVALQAFADTLPRSPDDLETESEFYRLGAMLDAYSVGAVSADAQPPTRA
jgi:hypothetical protein